MNRTEAREDKGNTITRTISAAGKDEIVEGKW